MHVVGKKILDAFKRAHREVEKQIDAWLCEAEEAQWNSPRDVKKRYPKTSFLHDNQVIFDLKGNKFRLLVKINYDNHIVSVKRYGTHADYSRWRL